MKVSIANLPSAFNRGASQFLTISNLDGSVNNTDLDLNIGDNELSDAQNMSKGSGRTLSSRKGIDEYGQYLGATTGILGGFTPRSIAGVEENLCVYDTSIMRYVSGVWTALTGVTMTTNKPADGVFFPFTNKYYIVNKTDNVVKYTIGSAAGDQTDAAFKKGAYIEEFFNRVLVAGVSGQEDYVWYTDDQLDTFSGNNFFQVGGNITGLVRLDDKLLIFTQNNVYRLYGFSFDGTNSYASKLDTLPGDFGSIADRTIKKVGNKVFFIGLDARRNAALYVTDGFSIVNLSELKIGATLNTLATGLIQNACAVTDGNVYRAWITPSGDAYNNLQIAFDTNRNQFLPFETYMTKNIAAPACAWTITLNGAQRVLTGSQLDGQVSLLDENDTYDILGQESQTTTNANRDFFANASAVQVQRIGQSFKLSAYNASQTIVVDHIQVPIKYVSGTQTDLQLVIRSGSQTGTIVATSNTLTAFSTASYVWKKFTFTTAPSLTGNTTYYFQVKHVTEGTGNSVYNILTNTADNYASGNLYTYTNSAWTSVSAQDLCFRIYAQAIIDSYIVSKAFHPASVMQYYKANKFGILFGTRNGAGVEVGFAKDGQSSFLVVQVFPDAGSSATWGGGSTWGGGALWGGAQERQYMWRSIENLEGHSVKMMIRNRQPNKSFSFESLVLAYNPKNRMQ